MTADLGAPLAWVPEDVPSELALLIFSEPVEKRARLRRDAQRARDARMELFDITVGLSVPRVVRTEPGLVIRTVNALRKAGL